MNKHQKVLVVDDEVHILHVVSLKLRNGGYEVITAQDGNEALELAQTELPDLIITDYLLPYLSGLELFHRLNQIAQTRAISAIILTARGFALDDNAVAATGIKKCLNKPFSPSEVLKIVDGMLDTAQKAVTESV